MQKPTREQTSRELAPILPEIYRAFEHAIFKARTYFETEGQKVDHSLLSTLVRFHVKTYLQEKDFNDVFFYDTALCGVSFSYKRFHVRMWKSSDSELPSPGHSQKKQWFYDQQFVLPFPASDIDSHDQNNRSIEPDAHLNIAVLWNLNRAYEFVLWVACPKSFDTQSGEISVEWDPIEIKDPTLEISSSKKPERQLAELPITRKVVEVSK